MFIPNCVACATGFHVECYFPAVDNMCCCSEDDAVVNDAPMEITSDDREVVVQRKGKTADQMQDPISTGRKRAAALKPISKGMKCEWASLRYAGGGVIPIVGCFGGPATNIHHGPDKDVLNNDYDNLHRICVECHNRWHALNDVYYGERPVVGEPFIPLSNDCLEHDAVTKADPKILFESELWWTTHQADRKPYFNEPSPLLEMEIENG